MTIQVSSSDPSTMEVKEPTILIPAGQIGKIKLGFAEVSEPTEKELFLYIHFKEELRETIQIKVKYVAGE